ncbi:hypothetical protein ABK046_50350, partial [Streptomyces caeruleatus]
HGSSATWSGSCEESVGTAAAPEPIRFFTAALTEARRSCEDQPCPQDPSAGWPSSPAEVGVATVLDLLALHAVRVGGMPRRS